MKGKPMLLGIAGEKESGKNTAAELLGEIAGVPHLARGLADVLKISAAKALGFEANDDAGLIRCMDQFKSTGYLQANIEHGPNDIQESDLSGREFLQRYGTEAHRDVFADSFWIDYLLPLDSQMLSRRWTVDPKIVNPAQLMMVTDVRFPNEAQRVRQLRGFVLEICKSGGHSGDTHSSEKPLPRDMVDFRIKNDQGIKEFTESLREFYERFMKSGLTTGNGKWNTHKVKFR